MLSIVICACKTRNYREHTNYIKMEIGRSYTLEEKAFWEQELKKHYARLNPFYRLKKKK